MATNMYRVGGEMKIFHFSLISFTLPSFVGLLFISLLHLSYTLFLAYEFCFSIWITLLFYGVLNDVELKLKNLFAVTASKAEVPTSTTS